MNGCPPLALACRAASAGRGLIGALALALDARFALRAALWTVASLLAFGLVSAIIPNPVFGRSVPPQPFAYVVWVLSAPLMGLIAATYGGAAATAKTTSARAIPLTAVGPNGRGVSAVPITFARSPGPDGALRGAPVDSDRVDATGRASTAATVGSVAAFVAIGCPLCNKIALLLLGASGALTVFAPLQPIIGAASLVLLAVTLWWRLRILATGGACAVPAS